VKLDIDPTHPSAWDNLGYALEKQGKLGEAITAYERQVEVKPDHTKAQDNLERVTRELGFSLYRQGKSDEAMAAFQRYAQLQSDPADAWDSLGQVFYEQGNYKAAAAAFAKGLAEQPTNLALLSHDAELALARGDTTRLQSLIAVALPQVESDDELSVILPFFSWLAHPAQEWENLRKVVSKLPPRVHFTWDFSGTERIITRLDRSTQRRARHLMNFFKGRIDLPTLKARLAAK
jgi:tetratricopeptide (TPR) repeat protein